MHFVEVFKERPSFPKEITIVKQKKKAKETVKEKMFQSIETENADVISSSRGSGANALLLHINSLLNDAIEQRSGLYGDIRCFIEADHPGCGSLGLSTTPTPTTTRMPSESGSLKRPGLNDRSIVDTSGERESFEWSAVHDYFVRQMETVLVPGQKSRRGLPASVFKKVQKLKFGHARAPKECTICTNTIAKGDIIRVLPCGHMFHSNCLKPWFACNTTCPNCRFDLQQHFGTSGFNQQDQSSRSERFERAEQPEIPRARPARPERPREPPVLPAGGVPLLSTAAL
eukprot:TRINITY_DN1364_c0_g1_i4.p1 TRINITY_DN1364_c0_g1~~TRINITY_DN1364_c0_g1_i4.p1  ORF type:complete len:286 (+),score=-2.70 TRINITY_DN1364_c0_g1_i4:359-1216(+)